MLLVGLLGAWLVSRRLRRQTHGLGEREITRMYEYYSAVLHAVREGCCCSTTEGRVQLVNDEARRLLDLPDDVGRPLRRTTSACRPGWSRAVRGAPPEPTRSTWPATTSWWSAPRPRRGQGREVGAVVTLRDHTELQAVTGELDVVRGLTESLRSQNHEAANRLHTVVSLIEMGRPDEAVDFATEELELAQLLTDRVVGAVGDPVVAALLLGKSARGRRARHRADRQRRAAGRAPVGSARDLVTVLGNLVDNALDAVAGSRERRVVGRPRRRPPHAPVAVADSGPGLTPERRAACWSAAGPPRPTPATATGSAWRWSRRCPPPRRRGHHRPVRARRRRAGRPLGDA